MNYISVERDQPVCVDDPVFSYGYKFDFYVFKNHSTGFAEENWLFI